MKSKVEIRNNIVNILNECNGTSSGANRIVDYVYAAMKEYASQQAPASTPPVSAMEDETEKIFKPYCIDFFSKESEEERKIKIDFALNKKNESFSLFQSMYDQNYGSINIDENLVSIHTGGWSENEYLISIFKNTEWWRQNFRIQITGGHYYFDTDRINGMKEWDITKRISTTPTK